MILYVGNLAERTTAADLRKSFEAHGRVSSVSLPAHPMANGKPAGPGRGYAFVTLPDPREAEAAVRSLHGKDFLGRPLDIRRARPAQPRRRS
jgi:RNA recognition motif-containing protein